MKYIRLLLPVMLLQCCHAQPVEKLKSNGDENTLLWEISGKDITKASYLFGTFHLMCKDDIHFSTNLKQAVRDAKEVYFELDLDDASSTLGAIFFMNMKDGKKLKDLYTEKEYKRLADFFKDSLNTGLGLLEKMKPGLLEALLYPRMMNCKNASGVEESLMQLAKTDNKEIKGLETIAFQASMFDSIPYEVQAQELLKAIDSMPAYKMDFNSMLTAYKNQQLSTLNEMMNEPGFGMDEGNKELMLDKRNMNWVDQLKKIMPDTNVFVAVGAGHLVGDKGLIALLKKQGYIVRPVLNRVFL